MQFSVSFDFSPLATDHVSTGEKSCGGHSVDELQAPPTNFPDLIQDSCFILGARFSPASASIHHAGMLAPRWVLQKLHNQILALKKWLCLRTPLALCARACAAA
jgi:hypothetical protein